MAVPIAANQAVNVASKSARAANVASAVSAGGDIAASAITLISGISDRKKRAAFEQNFASLNLEQQNKLNKLLLDANSETERLTILTQALASSNVKRISNIAEMYAEQERKKRNEKLLIAGGVLVIGLVAVVLIVKKA